MGDQEKKIRILKDGPYMVSGNVPLDLERYVLDENGDSVDYEKSRTYETPETYNLCRCGHSKARPFCDGTHRTNGFSASVHEDKSKYQEKADVIEGGTIDLLDQRELCVAARFCEPDGTVWRLTKASSEAHPEYEKRAIEEACHCPSGRLTVRKDGKLIEPELDQEISLLEDPKYDVRAPIFVKGGIPLEDENGDLFEEKNRRTLCRCGESKNMPFCDASHYNCEHMKGSDV